MAGSPVAENFPGLSLIDRAQQKGLVGDEPVPVVFDEVVDGAPVGRAAGEGVLGGGQPGKDEQHGPEAAHVA